MKIHNEFDLYHAINGRAADNREYAQAMIEKDVYKGTDCGAWIAFKAEGVLLGSIVEGSDAEVKADLLPWGFTEEEFWEVATWVDEQASLLWHEANDEDWID